MNILKTIIGSVSIVFIANVAIAQQQQETSQGKCRHVGETRSTRCSLDTSANAFSASTHVVLKNGKTFEVHESDTDNKLNGTSAIVRQEGDFKCFINAKDQQQNICFK